MSITVQPAAAARGDVELAGFRAGGEQGHVPAGEIEMLEVLDLELLAAVAEVDDVAGRARRSDRGDLVERELPLGEDVEDFAPDIAGRANDRDPIAQTPYRSCLQKELRPSTHVESPAANFASVRTDRP